MRIAIFSDAYVPETSGVATAVHNFVTLLAKRGHKFILFVPQYPGHKDKPIKNVKIHRYIGFNLPSNKASKFVLPNVPEILLKVKRFNPDVIHIQDPFNMGWVGTLASKLYDIPNIQHYHTYLPDFMQYISPIRLTGLDRAALRVRQSRLARRIRVGRFLKRIHLKKSRVFRVSSKALRRTLPALPNFSRRLCWGYTRGIYNTADLVITPSKCLKSELRRNGIRVPIVAMSNGIEVDKIPTKTDYSSGLKLLHVGRLGHEKRIDVVIRAMKLVVEREPKAMLHIYGPGPALEKLKALTSSLGIANNVVFMGGIPREELLKTYKNYDIFVTASPMETQGLVVVEAMAAGLPIVGVRKLAVPEMAKHGFCGFMAPHLNYKKIASYLLKLISNQKLRERMGRAARKAAEAHDLGKVMDELEAHYAGLCKKDLK